LGAQSACGRGHYPLGPLPQEVFSKDLTRDIHTPIHTQRPLRAIGLGPLSALTTDCDFSPPKSAKQLGAVLDRQALNRGVSHALLGIRDAFSWLEGGTLCSRVHFSTDRLIFIPSHLTAFTIKGPPRLGPPRLVAWCVLLLTENNLPFTCSTSRRKTI
jgi:hypothetical protein